MLPVSGKQPPQFNPKNTTSPTPPVNDLTTKQNSTVRSTDTAGYSRLQTQNSDNPKPDRITVHAVTPTPVPKTPAELFKKSIESDNARQRGDWETAEKKMKEYVNDVKNLTIKKVALFVFAVVAVAAVIGAAVAIASLVPPIGIVGAGAAISIAMGLAYGTTAGVCLITSAAIILDPDDPELPEGNREQLSKNLQNTNRALELFKDHPKNRANPDGSSYEEFLDTLPALTKDGVRSYELDSLDKYNNLFTKKLKLDKLTNFETIRNEKLAAENQLRDLGFEDPIDEESIQNRINELKEEFKSPIDTTSSSDTGIEMQDFSANPNKETIESLVETIVKLSSDLSELRKKFKEAQAIFQNDTEESLKNEINTDREALTKAIAEKQKQSDLAQPDREIEALNKELAATKQTYVNQLGRLKTPTTELPDAIQQKEKNLREGLIKIRALEKESNQDAQIQELKEAQTRLTSEISELKSIIANKDKIDEIGSKIVLLKNKKQIQELKVKSEQLETKLEELKNKANAVSKGQYTIERINLFKNEIINPLKASLKKGEVGPANEGIKKLETAIHLLTEEANYRSEVNNRFAEFKEKHSKLSPEDKENRLKEAAWKNTEEYKYYEAERDKYDKLIEEEIKKLDGAEYSRLQGSLRREFTELKKLHNHQNIVFTAYTGYINGLKAVVVQ